MHAQENVSALPLTIPTARITLFGKLLPAEWVVLAFACVCCVLKVGFGVQWYLPSASVSDLLFQSIMGATTLVLGGFMAISIPFGIWGTARRDPQALGASVVRCLRLLVTFFVMLILFGNVKLWSMLINPFRFDSFYYAIDQHLGILNHIAETVSTPFYLVLPGMNPYHDIFVGMFFLTFTLCAIKGGLDELEHVITASIAVGVVGALGYCVAPAFGPFIYEHGPRSIATIIQSKLYNFVTAFLASGGHDFDGSMFAGGLGAMPSLHVACAVAFTRYAFRTQKLIGAFYVIVVIYLTTEAVTSNWHYWVDVPAGVLVALVGLWITDRLMEAKQRDRAQTEADLISAA